MAADTAMTVVLADGNERSFHLHEIAQLVKASVRCPPTPEGLRQWRDAGGGRIILKTGEEFEFMRVVGH